MLNILLELTKGHFIYCLLTSALLQVARWLVNWSTLRSYVTFVFLLLLLLVTSADTKHNVTGGALALRDLNIFPKGVLCSPMLENLLGVKVTVAITTTKQLELLLHSKIRELLVLRLYSYYQYKTQHTAIIANLNVYSYC